MLLPLLRNRCGKSAVRARYNRRCSDEDQPARAVRRVQREQQDIGAEWSGVPVSLEGADSGPADFSGSPPLFRMSAQASERGGERIWPGASRSGPRKAAVGQKNRAAPTTVAQ